MSAKALTVWASAILGVVAAICWMRSSIARVDYSPKQSKGKSAVVFYEGDVNTDVILTMKLQSKWNRFAAAAASLSAVFQAISLCLPD